MCGGGATMSLDVKCGVATVDMQHNWREENSWKFTWFLRHSSGLAEERSFRQNENEGAYKVKRVKYMFGSLSFSEFWN